MSWRPDPVEQAKERERLARIEAAKTALGRAKDILEVARAVFPVEIGAAEPGLVNAETRIELGANYRKNLKARADAAWREARELRVKAAQGDEEARKRSDALLSERRDLLEELRCEEEAVPLGVLAILEEHEAVLELAEGLFMRKRAALIVARDGLAARVEALATKLRALRREHREAGDQVDRALAVAGQLGEVLHVLRAEREAKAASA